MSNYIYNGVELPALPEWDKTAYPYSVLSYDRTEERYELHVSCNAIVYKDTSVVTSLSIKAPWKRSRLVDGKWSAFSDHSTDLSYTIIGMLGAIVTDTIWCNADILKADGSVYLAASEPVPVGGDPDEPDPDGYRGKDTITLGSGTLYFTEYDGETLPDVDTLCVEDNRLGSIKGGAALEYTEEPYEEKDDLGLICKVITTNESATLKCGLITWNAFTLHKLIDRCTVETADGKRIVKIGGHGNSNGKTYAICFHHEDKKDGDLWVVLVGRNTAGFTITFGTDAGSLIEPEFKALPSDEDGTLVVLIEGSPSR